MANKTRLNIDGQWFKNKKVRPKTFNVTMERSSSGEYKIVSAVVEVVVNQHRSFGQVVDVRDLSADISRNKVCA